MNSQSNPRILFIGGEGRSGSTILDMLVGQISQFQSTGELNNIWLRGFLEDDPCSCGKTINQCKFWSEVISEAFGVFDKQDAKKIFDLQIRLHRKIFIPHYKINIGSKNFNADLATYRNILRTLYFAIAKISGNKILIDSSIYAPYAFILSGIPDFEIRYIHLVRDSRAVANSWSKLTTRNPGYNEDKILPIFSTITSSQKWVVNNLLFRLFYRLNNSQYSFINYENFASNPETILFDIANLFDIQNPNLNFIISRTANIGETHIIAGNPVRFKHGKIQISPNYEWKNSMRRKDRNLTTAITWPWLLKYGYFNISNRGW